MGKCKKGAVMQVLWKNRTLPQLMWKAMTTTMAKPLLIASVVESGGQDVTRVSRKHPRHQLPHDHIFKIPE
eukprot:4225695-Amphidinium_carterae.1